MCIPAHQNRVGKSSSLHAGGDIGCVAKNISLAASANIHHNGTGMDAQLLRTASRSPVSGSALRSRR